MYKIIEYERLDKNEIDGTYALIDVRSPSEHNKETIPGSINIPVLDDEERAIVGTTYIQESTKKAKRLGVELVSKKLLSIYDETIALSEKYNYLIFFCYRGGMRSATIVSLFDTLGINTLKLNGGYKKYRKYITENLPKVCNGIKFIVLYGNTGTGKTQILEYLEKEGMDVLDLEKCANHRGSYFGSVGLSEQNSQKMFESLIYESLKNRKTNIVFVEGESKRIGKVNIPDYLFNAMDNGIPIKIDASIENRIKNIMLDYVHDNDDELISNLNFLKNKLGNRNIEKYTEMIRNSRYEEVINEIIVKYYDPLYENRDKKYYATFVNDNSEETAKKIIEWVKYIK